MYLLVNLIKFIASLIPAFLLLLIPLYFYNTLYPDYRWWIVASSLIPFALTLLLELTGTFTSRSLSTAAGAAAALAGLIGLVVEWQRLTANLTAPVLEVFTNEPGYFLSHADRYLILACLLCIGAGVFHNTQAIESFRHKRKARVNKTAHGSASWLSAQDAQAGSF